ncbi:polysaccharide biosynthesis tyrosine autokinase [Carboxylicivirga sediminis]|uniref:non-specific protein-tyrosine kinase n=1 Tax=Carboxylicivirga sediminis TaxID=2006564 RepID=A0A941F693_9BACT|nr:tyrosine-protein kinase [Carboxylicivirga sediminis]MBR8537486.1 polysaccharide biosynthesis tyrosine autokinase [Carboxylicivirga sediminis]
MLIDNDVNQGDLKVIIAKVLRYWYLYPICVLMFTGMGIVYQKYSQPVYSVGAKIVVHQQERGTIDPTRFFSGYELFSGRTNFENSLITLQSRPLLEKVFEKLDFNVAYFRQELFYEREIFNNVPFQVVLDKNTPQLTNTKFSLKILNSKEYQLELEEAEGEIYDFSKQSIIESVTGLTISKKYRFGDVVESENYKFVVLLKEGIDVKKSMKHDFNFEVKSNQQLARDYYGRLSLTPTSREASAINVTMVTYNIRKGMAFLDAYLKTVIEDNLDNKNHIAQSTVAYIDQQLTEVYDSLDLAERSLQQFQSKEQVLDVNMKASQIYESIRQIEIERSAKESQIQYLQFLNNSFSSGDEDTEYSLTTVSDLGNQVLNDLLNEYISLTARKRQLIENNQGKSPRIKDLDFQIRNLRNTILVNLEYAYDAANNELSRINRRMSSLNAQLNTLPETQRNLVGYERNFRLHDATYIYLMEKRAEAQIAKIANLPDYEVFDYPSFAGIQSPKRMRILMFTIFLGLMIPTIFILIYETFFERFNDVDDFQLEFNLPVMGQIFKVPGNKKQLFEDKDLIIYQESFRKLRSNIDFFNWKHDKGRVLLVTSTIPGEGKSFCSYNLTSAFAALGKKTLLLDFDLRKGGLSFDFFNDKERGHGMTEVMSKQKELKDVIRTSDNELSFDYITCGAFPPNPSELIENENTEKLLEDLREQYDFIIIDSAPVSLTSEGSVLSKFSDMVLYVLRMKHTMKKDFKNGINELKVEDHKTSVVLNNIKVNRQKYYYGNYYSKK